MLPAETRRVPSSQPPLPAPLPLTPMMLLSSAALVSKESIHIHAEVPDLPPPCLLPPPALETGNQDTDASTLVAQGTPLPPVPRGISQLHHLFKAQLHPPWAWQGWKERGQAPCPVTPPHWSCPPGLSLKSTQTSPLPQYLAPQCPGALFIPREPQGSARLPAICPRATRPPQTCVQHHAQKSTPQKNAAETDTVGSTGQATGTWTARRQSTSCKENWPRAEILWL